MLHDNIRRLGVVALIVAIIASLWFMAAIKADPMIIGPSFTPRFLTELRDPKLPSLRLQSFAMESLDSGSSSQPS